VLVNARRQVLIEATIVEVQLSHNYQQGVNWEIIARGSAGIGGSLIPQGVGLIGTPTASIFTLSYKSNTFNATIKLLEQFGNVRVVSSPRLSVINNQTAILKVVDNLVYFTISSQASQSQAQTLVTFTTTPAHRSRNCGRTACVIAMTPKVLVSNTSRVVAIGVASKAPTTPMPALLTSASTCPLASTAAAMLSGFVTSSASTRSRSDRGRMSSRGVRMVATTSQPCA